MSKRRIILSFCLILAAFNLMSQEQDFNIWTEASVEKAINKKISVVVVEEFRFDNNATTFDEWHTTIGTGLKLNQYLRFRLSYRYSLNNTLKRGYQNSHRVMTDGVFRYKYKRFIFRYRLRYQMDYVKIDNLEIDGQFIRNRIGVKYNIRKTPLMPFINYESYYNVGSFYGRSIEKHRITGGFDYDVTDYFSARIYYRYQTSSGASLEAYNRYILGLSVGFEF